MTESRKTGYVSPEIEKGGYIPALLCQSLVDGGSEDIVDEDWDF